MPDAAQLLAAAQEKFPGLVEDIAIREDEDHMGTPSLFIDVIVPNEATEHIPELIQLWHFLGKQAADDVRFAYVEFDTRKTN
ncbi:MAG: hypothetical protein SFV18_09855 [Bryobacteraceae bacterium]|nr:hypothetical protein [Bryobacteraceae bacterium]